MRRDGYYTVEAVFIVSICIWVLIALCYTGFYAHDSLLLESAGNEQTAAWIADGANGQGKWEKSTKKELQKKMFLFQIKSVKAQKGLTGIKVKVHYSLPVSWKKLKQMLSQGKSELVEEIERENVQAARYLWDYELIKANKRSGKKG